MESMAKKHQKRIAYSTLKMTPIGANIMRGMSYEEAYKFIFKTNLKDRLNELIAEYGDKVIVWELSHYGWVKPIDLLKAL